MYSENYKWVFQKFVKLLYISFLKCSFVNGIIKVGSIMIGRKFTLPLRFRRCCIFGKKSLCKIPFLCRNCIWRYALERKEVGNYFCCKLFNGQNAVECLANSFCFTWHENLRALKVSRLFEGLLSLKVFQQHFNICSCNTGIGHKWVHQHGSWLVWVLLD